MVTIWKVEQYKFLFIYEKAKKKKTMGSPPLKTVPPQVGAWFICAILRLYRHAKWRGKYMFNLKALFLLVYLDTFRLAF
jgi:hypothetical protein